MKYFYSQPLLIFLILGVLFSAKAQSLKDTTQVDTATNMPSKETIIDTKHDKLQTNPIQEYNEAYYILGRLNDGIGLPSSHYNLQTPQAALEHFIAYARNEEFEEAAYALNLNLLPSSITKEEAGILAEKFYFVLNQRVKIDWTDLPDRPDGQIDISTTTNKAVAGKPRRSIVFGEINLDDRRIVLRVQRVKYKDYGAFWMISSNTIENIEDLYKIYGPRKLDRAMPSWARMKIWNTPIWKPVGTMLLIVLSYFLGKGLLLIIRKLFLKSDKVWVNNIAKRLSKPAGITFGILIFYILLNELISFTGPSATTLYATLLIIVISSITWLIMRLIDYLMVYVAEYKIGDTNPEENSEARMMLTYISVARRIVTFVVIIIGASVILSQFRSLEKLGISLLASAGVATVILGIAAQSTLGNIIAGIQIAITKPARIGDTVIINDDWGYVEDIRFTYMVVRTWDLRRLIVPLRFIVSNTFENWSMTSANQIRPITLYADYRIDVSKIRKKFKEILEQEEDWDENHPPTVQVVDVTEKSIEIRALCSSKDATHTWDLHCKLREKLVRYISELEDGAHLAKARVALQENHRDKES
ncbi:mechanosensitive ion channel family protein [Mesonia ostreae]|uniref:Mechanosensitive ion channel n=1 Tax=Mesonia ostreae TaxID=861110 RepID=A0ABU2KF03_9FLAO|nr:mechanosensitive ion channel domain-containing protein [Mesonia ostreae]MDT0293279.1 mechanosensitive ion channel [Mesonia ostreae]